MGAVIFISVDTKKPHSSKLQKKIEYVALFVFRTFTAKFHMYEMMKNKCREEIKFFILFDFDGYLPRYLEVIIQ